MAAQLESQHSAQQLYTPRTNSEQLQLTGKGLHEAAAATESVAAAIVALSERAKRDRSQFVAKVREVALRDLRSHAGVALEQVQRRNEVILQERRLQNMALPQRRGAIRFLPHQNKRV